MEQKTLSVGAPQSYWLINEALCSSCNMKPEKFHIQERDHDGFHA